MFTLVSLIIIIIRRPHDSSSSSHESDVEWNLIFSLSKWIGKKKKKLVHAIESLKKKHTHLPCCCRLLLHSSFMSPSVSSYLGFPFASANLLFLFFLPFCFRDYFRIKKSPLLMKKNERSSWNAATKNSLFLIRRNWKLTNVYTRRKIKQHTQQPQATTNTQPILTLTIYYTPRKTAKGIHIFPFFFSPERTKDNRWMAPLWKCVKGQNLNKKSSGLLEEIWKNNFQNCLRCAAFSDYLEEEKVIKEKEGKRLKLIILLFAPPRRRHTRNTTRKPNTPKTSFFFHKIVVGKKLRAVWSDIDHQEVF